MGESAMPKDKRTQRKLAAGKNIPAQRPSLLTGDSDPAVVAKVAMIQEEDRRKALIHETVDLAAKDERFRRLMLDKLQALGAGKRGTKTPEFEKRMLENSFAAARDYLVSKRKNAGDTDAAALLAAGLYAGTDADALLKRLRRYRQR